MTDRVLNVENLSIEIPLADGVLHAVDDISLHVDRGETLCIVGESGCGKSLTSLALMDLLPKKAIRKVSQLDLNGESILGLTEKQMSNIRGNRIGMIFQEPMTSLNPAFTIENQMAETLSRHKSLTGNAATKLALEMLEKVGISFAQQRLNNILSTLRRSATESYDSMTLLCDPELIIADEPTTALDVTIQAQILDLLRQLQQDLNVGLIFITHDLGVVANIADRVAVMYAGQIVEEGSVFEIFDRPTHPYTRGLLQCIPVPGKVKRGEPLGSIPGMVPSLIGEPEGCRFSGRWSQSSTRDMGRDITIRSIETRTRTFQVNDNANHLVRFCCDECLIKSDLKIAPMTASGAVA